MLHSLMFFAAGSCKIGRLPAQFAAHNLPQDLVPSSGFGFFRIPSCRVKKERSEDKRRHIERLTVARFFLLLKSRKTSWRTSGGVQGSTALNRRNISFAVAEVVEDAYVLCLARRCSISSQKPRKL